LFAVLAAFVFIALATLRWDAWIGSATVQTTNDAYVRAELTRLSSRVAGEVITVAVQDFQRVKAGDLLVQIDPADYAAQVAQAEASVAAAQAALDNLSNQVELQYATIAQAEAQLVSAAAQEVEARQEQERQQSLSQTESGTRQKLEQATAAFAKAQADVRASRAVIAAQRHQLEVLSGTKKQRAADIEGAKATLAAARLKLGYTKIVAPFDGVTGERQVQPGDYVNIGTNLINVVPLPNVYVIANTRETQLTQVKPGQPVEITVDSFLERDTTRLRRADCARRAVAIRAAAAGQCHRQFHQSGSARPGPDPDRQEPAVAERLLPGMSVAPISIPARRARMAEMTARSRIYLARRERATQPPLFAVGAVLLGAFLANFDSRLTTVGLLRSARRVLARFRRGRLALTAGIGSQILIAPAVAWLATVFSMRCVLGIPAWSMP
jgi:membrane fusion protein (multidrug efflux system)